VQELRYPIIIHWSEEDKKYLATLPDFPYSTTHGDSYEEALKNGKEVLEMLIEGSIEDNQPLPQPSSYAA
jgi:predicted RNase H-like HicB family nuclease